MKYCTRHRQQCQPGAAAKRGVQRCIASHRLQEDLEQVARDALDGVINGQHVDALAVLDVLARVHRHDIAEADAQVVAHDAVHPHFGGLAGVIRQDDAHGLLPALPLEDHGVPTKEVQLFHCCRVQRDDTVVIVVRLLYKKAVRLLLRGNGRRRGISRHFVSHYSGLILAVNLRSSSAETIQSFEIY